MEDSELRRKLNNLLENIVDKAVDPLDASEILQKHLIGRLKSHVIWKNY